MGAARRGTTAGWSPAETLVYPPGAWLGDCLRGALGALACGLVLPWLPLDAPAFSVLAALCALFAGFALHAARRRRVRIALAADGVRVGGDAPLRWRTLRALSLHYYSTRRDREDGWMQLTLRADGARVRVDSRLQGFERVARRAAEAAAANGLTVAPASAANFAALGIRVRDEGAAP